NDPNLGNKVEFNLIFSAALSGTICHPALCKTLALPEILRGDEIASVEVSLKGTGMVQATGGFFADESLADASWKVNNEIQAQGSFGLEVTVEGTFNFGGYTLEGSTSAGTEAGIIIFWDSGKPEYLQGKVYVVPLKITFGLHLQ